MNQPPLTGYLRLKQILGNKKTNPPINPIIPIGKTSWWLGIKEGKFPQPIKLSPRITVWRVEDIRALCEKINGMITQESKRTKT
jgi:prophage regulatory protein